MKTKSILTLLALIAFTALSHAQESEENPIKKLFIDQLSAFPQEKIYVQTNKGSYYPGETIWMRVHLVDAIFMKQANASRYVYVELINPAKHLVERVKLRPDSTGCFYGHIQLDEEIGEGDYLLRAYTRFMQNVGEDYFFTKHLYISNPVSEKVSVDINYKAEGNGVNAELLFSAKGRTEKLTPGQCVVFSGGTAKGNAKTVSFKDKTGSCSFTGKEVSKEKVFLLQAVIESRMYKRYFKIPDIEKTFDVSFFPEGGYAPLSVSTTMAFKALNNRGWSEDVKGQVFDDQNHLCTEFESSHLGMGSFKLFYSPGRKYYAMCTNKEKVMKRFELPAPSDSAVSLKTVWRDNKLLVRILKSPGFRLPPQTQLIAHARGVPIYVDLWDEKKDCIAFEKDFFPAGVIHFLLIDKERNILTERLIFSMPGSTLANAHVDVDQEKHQTRDKINLSIQLTDENKAPLSGNFSLAVVDANGASIDTTSNIISSLLLSSEIKGYIEDPASYLRQDGKKSEAALDVLMITQGWRRYDIPKLLKGKLTKALQYPVELGEEISGKAEGVFSSLKGGNISLLALKDSVEGVELAKTDNAGRFLFKNLEYCEGTRYIIQATANSKSKKAFLEMDSTSCFPSLVTQQIISRKEPVLKDSFLLTSNKRYSAFEGMKTYHLGEVMVTAKRKVEAVTESPYYSVTSSKVITAKDIEGWHVSSTYDLLRRLAGVTVNGTDVRYRGNKPMLLLDNVPTEDFDYSMLMIDDIQDIFVNQGATMGAIFGTMGSNGAIVINTKNGFVQTNTINPNIKVVKALGYQQPVKFYSPVYSTEQERNSSKPDYRTTLLWNPNVQVDSTGMVNLSFYAADIPTTYRVVLEGISSLGHLIYSAEKEITVAPDKQ
ncbi:MAG: TonB-dependent receptor plug domain-containing protein [Bacteroidota bacterium]|nr:TonB-dependent receptor plug domain-containing protein [Bacteroidota bacterium]